MSKRIKRGAPPSAPFSLAPGLAGGLRRGGVRIIGHGGGGKGGGKARAPVEAPDSLHSISYAKVLDAVSEGPIVGPVHGWDELLRDIYLDETPVQNEDGTLNFEGVVADFRSGTQDQDYIPGFPASESMIGVGVELRADQPFVRQLTNTALSAARITLEFRGLTSADTKKGDISGYRVEYAIDVQTDGGAYVTVLQAAADGKTTSSYSRTHRVDLPKATNRWNLRVRRLTPNANSATVGDTTFVHSIAEVIDVKLRHPMTALVGLQVDASQFQSVPARAYHLRGRILSVPSNYDPERGNYAGVWDGTFKQAYSNNPAWVFYDIVSNDRYGMGAFIPAGKLSQLKWSLYQIARYCDELVPDGLGGQERRFTCNLYLQSQADAWRVISDIAGIFRGMAYETGGAILAAADMPSDPAYNYSAGNIIGGRVTYTGSPLSTRYTLARVSWTDMSDMGRAKVEVVTDQEGQARYGIRPLDITAFGCSSRSQAIRAGQWALLTSRLETQVAQWQVGMDEALVAPGKVVRLADPHLAGRQIGGRIHAATATEVTVDVQIGVRPGDRLVVNLPSGISESRTVSDAVGHFLTADSTEWTADSTEITADMVGLPGSTLKIVVTQPFSEVPAPEAVWTLESEDLSVQLMRILSVAKKDGIVAEIKATQYEPSKFPAIDHGTKLDPLPVTVIPPSVQPAPGQVLLTSRSVIDQGIARHDATISWSAVSGATAYQVQWRRDNSDWIEGGRTGSCELDLADIRAGAYVARVRAINAANVPSIWAVSQETVLEGDLAPPPAVPLLTAKGIVFGIELGWAFPEGPLALEHTELRYSSTPSFDDAIPLGVFPYPQRGHTLMGLSSGRRLWFWARFVDRLGLPGPWFPEAGAGILGEASADASEILDYIKGQIDQTMLSAELKGEIAEIPGLKSGLAQEIADRTLQGQQLGAAITAEEDARKGEDEALARRVTAVAAKADANAAAIQVEEEARASADEALSQRVTTVAASAAAADTKANGAQQAAQAASDLAGGKGKVLYGTSAPAAADRQSQNLWIDTSGGANTPKRWNGSAWSAVTDKVATDAAAAAAAAQQSALANAAAIQREELARADADSALAQSITTVSAATSAADGKAQAAQDAAQAASDLAGGKGKVIFRSSAPVAADRLPQNLWIDTAGNANTPKRWNGSAWVAATDKAATDAAAAAAAAQQGVATNAAAIQQEATARANADGALSQLIDTAQATAGDAKASAQLAQTAVASTDGKLAAMTTIKTQVTSGGKPFMAGIGVGVENDNGLLTSQILLSAQRVAVLDEANGGESVPFVIQGGKTYINQALIGDAWIRNAMIESLRAEKVTAGEMSAERIESNSLKSKLANFDTAYIKTAHIGLAEVDTLRLKSGAVVAGNVMSVYIAVGRTSGTNWQQVTIDIPYGASGVLIFWDLSVSGGPWSNQLEIGTNLYGTILSGTGDAATYASWGDKSFYVGGSVASGSQLTLTVYGQRPRDGTCYTTGRVNILVIQR
ncbi:Domain of uncharacterised function (DUF1983) [Bordetella trematum]|uniref:Domain of uncharacterized function (DUF1983) n=1 Tax=Bordetella trematum TaxID=123899 RepID=A0A157S7W3_9BORD|nr:phage tail protein [Bordetella trematum]SAH87833.1 Domain of uncharacterised function (DUF1983) [Bordetella trematum]SAI66494.1 Domain of uncharacterised function (DUF1983) [Bordetella trematum]SUV96583.1 Domain of uncharacterised function (DUF1983) [Bordetella trematum]